LLSSYELVIIRGIEEHERPLSRKFNTTFSSTLVTEEVKNGRIASGGFSDGFPFLLTSRQSLRQLNQWTIPEGRKLEMETFRPNIIIDGSYKELKPWEEDEWKSIQIGGTINDDSSNSSSSSSSSFSASQPLTLSISKPCSRCILTTVVPSTGQRHPTGEPLISMRKYRKIFNETNRGPESIEMENEVFFWTKLFTIKSY